MPSSRINLRIPARYLAPAVLALALAVTASCSDVWDDVGGFFEDDEANDRALSQSGDDEDFPKLSDVPDTPRPASSPEQLDQLGEGLVADRDEARYTNETLRSRYADEPLGEQRQVAAAEAVQQSAAADSGEFADQERIGSAIEPASENILRDGESVQPADTIREASSYASSGDGAYTERRQLDSGQTVRRSDLTETRTAMATQTGVLSLSQFRALFNKRFDSSGSATYRQANVQQVSAQVSPVTPPPLASSTADIVPAQPPEPFDSPVDGGASAAVAFQAASIAFSIGSTAINSADRAALKQVAKLHQQFGGIVRVIGHASQRTRDMDADSHRLVNFQLSLDRATAVSMELTRLGVQAQAVMVVARSDNEPLSYEYMPAGEAENRRADVYIEY